MSTFMKMDISAKGNAYSCDCLKCGMVNYIHEWTTDDFNGDRDRMQEGTYVCPICGGVNDPESFRSYKNMYAGRYSAPGYLDCTDYTYDTNKRRLARELRELYED